MDNEHTPITPTTPEVPETPGAPLPGYGAPQPVHIPAPIEGAAPPPFPGAAAGDAPAGGFPVGNGGAGGWNGAPPPPVMKVNPPAAGDNGGKKKRSGVNAVLTALSLVMVVVLLLFTVGFFTLGGAISSLTKQQYYNANPPGGTFSVVTVIGTIQNVSGDALGINEPSYHHAATVAYIKQLAADSSNAGILLYMNTPGGGVLESDEVYLALQAYKQQTGRPVWAYMHATCASGGYYICAAADNIVANRNTTTGSIGVYIAMTDTSGLYEKLGIETVLVRSGPNKGTGMEGVPITEAQRSVYQSMVDEYYDQFVEIVADGRDMPLSQVLPLADGRVYTARQAVDAGLVDDIGDWETTLAAFMEETKASPYYPNFSQQTPLGRLLGSFLGQLPQGEAETLLSMAEQYPVGVPMALYSPAG